MRTLWKKNNLIDEPSHERRLLVMREYIKSYGSGIEITSDDELSETAGEQKEDAVFDEEKRKLRALGYLD
jgi:hypothetical protein